MSQLIKKLNRALSLIAGISISIMMFWIVADIFMRSFFNQSIIGTAQIIEEYFMIIAVYFGLSYTYLHDGHLVVDLIIVKLSKNAKKIIEVINHIIVLIIALFAGWIYLETAIEFQAKGTTSASLLAYPLAPIMYLLAFGIFVLCLTCILRIIETINSFRHKTEVEQEVKS